MADEILEKMRGQYEHRFRNDQKLKRIRKKLQNGANQAVAQEYAVAAGEILSDVLKENVTADLFGEAMPDAATLAGLIIPMMEQNYTHVVTAASASQKYMNSEGNLGMKPIEPEFDRNAAMNIVGRMANYDSFENAEWLMDEPIRTNSQHIADESLRQNAEFQYQSGLKPKIVRTSESGACEWCQMLEGEYDIDEITGKDDPVYQRHNNCQCEITFVPGEGRAENITDQMVNLGDIDDRIAKSREEAERWRKEYTLNRSVRKENDETTRFDQMGKHYVESIPIGGKTYEFRVYKNDEYKNISCQTYSKDSKEICSTINKLLNEEKKYSPVDEVVVIKAKNLGGGISAYDHVNNKLYIAEELNDPDKFVKIVDQNYFPALNVDDVIEHELGGHQSHWNAVKNFYEYHSDKYTSINEAKNDLEENLRKYVKTKMLYDSDYISNVVSENASVGFEKTGLNELIADVKVLKKQGIITDKKLFDLVDEVLMYDDLSE